MGGGGNLDSLRGGEGLALSDTSHEEGDVPIVH